MHRTQAYQPLAWIGFRAALPLSCSGNVQTDLGHFATCVGFLNWTVTRISDRTRLHLLVVLKSDLQSRERRGRDRDRAAHRCAVQFGASQLPAGPCRAAWRCGAKCGMKRSWAERRREHRDEPLHQLHPTRGTRSRLLGAARKRSSRRPRSPKRR